MDGREVLSFGITRAKGASDVEVYDEVQAVLNELREKNPKVSYRELFTSVNYTKDQFKSAMRAMMEGAVLAVIVVFWFLRDWRATIISAIAIPVNMYWNAITLWSVDQRYLSSRCTRNKETCIKAALLAHWRNPVADIVNVIGRQTQAFCHAQIKQCY